MSLEHSFSAFTMNGMMDLGSSYSLLSPPQVQHSNQVGEGGGGLKHQFSLNTSTSSGVMMKSSFPSLGMMIYDNNNNVNNDNKDKNYNNAAAVKQELEFLPMNIDSCFDDESDCGDITPMNSDNEQVKGYETDDTDVDNDLVFDNESLKELLGLTSSFTPQPIKDLYSQPPELPALESLNPGSSQTSVPVPVNFPIKTENGSMPSLFMFNPPSKISATAATATTTDVASIKKNIQLSKKVTSRGRPVRPVKRQFSTTASVASSYDYDDDDQDDDYEGYEGDSGDYMEVSKKRKSKAAAAGKSRNTVTANNNIPSTGVKSDMVPTAADEMRKFQCEECNSRFLGLASLKSHLLTHNTGAATFACTAEGCSKRYLTAEGLRLHIRNHHEVDKRWLCSAEGCGRRFVRQSDLRMHIIRMHSKVRPFSCGSEGCNKAFACHSELRRHITTAHKHNCESLLSLAESHVKIGSEIINNLLKDLGYMEKDVKGSSESNCCVEVSETCSHKRSKKI